MSLLRTEPEAKSCDGVLAEEDWLRSKQLEMIHVARAARTSTALEVAILQGRCNIRDQIHHA